MSGSVIVSPITPEGRIPTETRYTEENAAVGAYGLPKVSFERQVGSFK